MPTNTHDMLLVHRVFRREFGRMPGLIRAAAGNTKRSAVVGAYASEIVHVLHVHHHGEDIHLYPLLEQRVSFEQELVDRMEAQHKEVSDHLDAIEADLTVWSSSADAGVGERIASRIEQMMPTLDIHLAEEEDLILPIAAEHVTPEEWGKLAEHGLGALKPNRRMVVLGHILADTSPEEFAEFSAELPPPVRLLYKLFGKRKYEKEMAAVLG
jgi:hypothetical protein